MGGVKGVKVVWVELRELIKVVWVELRELRLYGWS